MSRKQNSAPTVMIMAGGTGGHVFPGLALAAELQKQNVQVVWLGTHVGLEAQWVKQAGIDFYPIDIQGLRGKGMLGWLVAPFRVLKAMRQARAILRQTQPDLVLGMGGFVCGPGGLATRWQGIPLWLHEQNAVVGLTNRLLAPLAEKIWCAFPNRQLQGKKVTVVGNPVRAGLTEVAPVKNPHIHTLLVLGGSRGAQALNQSVPQALALLPPEARPQRIVHQTGTAQVAATRTLYQDLQIPAEVVSFIEAMPQAYAQADFVIARAGALTVSELISAARPALLVPFPYAVDDHQSANAAVLVAAGGGQQMPQKALTDSALAQALQAWQQGDRLTQASLALSEQRPTAVAEQLAQRLLSRLQSS